MVVKLTAPTSECYEVQIGEEEVRDVVSVRALWNGGPGIIGYLPRNVRGTLYIDPSGDRVATAFRLGWRVIVRKVERTGIVNKER